MRRWIAPFLILGGFGFTIIGIMRLVADVQTARAGIADQVFDFGDARQGERLHHVFVIGNHLQRTAHIQSIRSSCGCTVIRQTPQDVAPGTPIEIPVEIDLTAKSGPFLSFVTLEMAGKAPVKLVTTGNVLQQFPSEVAFPPSLRGDHPTRRISILELGHRTLHLRSLKYNHSRLSVMRFPAEKRIDLQVEVLPTVTYGAFAETLDVETDDEVRPVKHITIKGEIRQPVEVQPAGDIVDSANPGEELTRHITLTSPYGEPIELERVHCTPADLLTFDLSEVQHHGLDLDVLVHIHGPMRQDELRVVSIQLDVKRPGAHEGVPLKWYVLTKGGGAQQ